MGNARLHGAEDSVSQRAAQAFGSVSASVVMMIVKELVELRVK
jgi:hypothetical protein